jgi:hypothetical protein
MGATTSIYVSSFDSYMDVLPPFFARFSKYWPDCPYQVFLGGVNKVYADAGVKTIRTQTTDWSSGMIECLRQIDCIYVIVLLDDFLIDRRVDNAVISRLISLMDRLQLHAIRLNPDPPPDIPMPAILDLGFQGEGQPNRISMQATLWRRESLLQLIHPGESIWEFEIYGTLRSNRYPGGICGCWKSVIHYVMGLNRGRWFRRALRSLASDGIHPDTSSRAVETLIEELRDFLQLCVATAIRKLLPLRWRQWVHMKIDPNVYRY